MRLCVDINDVKIISENIKVKRGIGVVDYFEGNLIIDKQSVIDIKKKAELENGIHIKTVEIFGYYKTKDQNGFNIITKVFNNNALKETYVNNKIIWVDVTDVEFEIFKSEKLVDIITHGSVEWFEYMDKVRKEFKEMS